VSIIGSFAIFVTPRLSRLERGNLTSGLNCNILLGTYGAVAQLGERINRTDEVRGSNPLSSTDGNMQTAACIQQRL
jgi:hypothetical protein